MPSTYVSEKFAQLAADGTSEGVADIGSNKGWLPGATVWLAATGQPSLECVIVEQIGADSVRLRRKDSQSKHGFSDISAYTTAGDASLSIEGQVVPVEQVFTPRERV